MATRTPEEQAEQDAIPDPRDPPVAVSLKFEDWISVLVLASLAVITFLNVIVRYLSSASFAWTEEISIFLMIVVTMTASSSAFVRRQHIRIEIIAEGGGARRQFALALVCNVVVLLFFVLLAVLSTRMAFDDFRWGDTSPAIGLPTWWYSMWIPVLAMVIALRVLGILRRLLRDAR